jgi:hypothetical protein
MGVKESSVELELYMHLTGSLIICLRVDLCMHAFGDLKYFSGRNRLCRDLEAKPTRAPFLNALSQRKITVL